MYFDSSPSLPIRPLCKLFPYLLVWVLVSASQSLVRTISVLLSLELTSEVWGLTSAYSAGYQAFPSLSICQLLTDQQYVVRPWWGGIPSVREESLASVHPVSLCITTVSSWLTHLPVSCLEDGIFQRPFQSCGSDIISSPSSAIFHEPQVPHPLLQYSLSLKWVYKMS